MIHSATKPHISMTKTNARSVEFLNIKDLDGALYHTVTGLGLIFQISIRETKVCSQRIQPQHLLEMLDGILQIPSYFITLAVAEYTEITRQEHESATEYRALRIC